MPIHDWSHVASGIFHHFHQAWTIEISHALNGGGLPPGFFAMAEQIVSGPIPDVVTLQRPPRPGDRPQSNGVALAEAPPQARFVTSAEPDRYARKANRILITHSLGQVVAVIEVVSPGNKNSRHALRSFVEKAEELLRRGIHLLVIDLFPPSPRDPQGIHKAIWDEIQDEPFELPTDKPLIVAAYSAGEPWIAYVEPVAVGDPLPGLPIFLEPGRYVPAPLEATYEATWAKCPEALREAVENPAA
ncbi:MAG: DUF4058 family protein [Planctomycetota bacterium]|nr:DUF4058 family protein [Planctomycetota bacterium]